MEVHLAKHESRIANICLRAKRLDWCSHFARENTYSQNETADANSDRLRITRRS